MNEKQKFSCFKGGETFHTDDYRIVTKDTKRGKMKFAVAKCKKHNVDTWRILGKVK